MLRATVLVLAVALFAVKRTFWTPDSIFIITLVVAVLFGRTRQFLVRALPLASLLLLYEIFRGLADDINRTVHFVEMINVDRWMFGGELPTVVLQGWLWNGSLQWYDFFLYFLYTIHFVTPAVLAFLLWKYRDSLYWHFVWALIGLSFAGFVTYILFPAAPPWMASEMGYFWEPFHRISSDVWGAMGVESVSKLYESMSVNQVAAVPSLHAAYPTLLSLYVVRAWGWRRFWPIFLYPAAMWFGIVYMGEHYVIDAILGAGYATGAYFAVEGMFALRRRHLSDWRSRIRQIVLARRMRGDTIE